MYILRTYLQLSPFFLMDVSSMRMQARDPNHFGSPLIIARCAKQITLTEIQVSVKPTLSVEI